MSGVCGSNLQRLRAAAAEARFADGEREENYMNDNQSAAGLRSSAPAWQRALVAPFRRVPVVGLGVFLAACSVENVASESIRTGGIHARMRAISPGDGTTVLFVDLAVGGQGGTKVDLTGTDELVYSLADGASGSLQQRSGGHYQAAFRGDDAQRLTISLEREVDPAASAEVSLPPPFNVRWPEGSVTVPTIDRSESVTILWSPPGPASNSTLAWEVAGDCIWTENGSTRDDGELTLPLDAVRVRGTRVGEACEVQVRLDRRAAGQPSANWGPGSSLEALQSRALTLLSVPSAAELEEDEPESAATP